MNLSKKTVAFEYLMIQCLSWYREVFPQKDSNDFSKLKVIKLLFFASAVNATEKEEALLSTFDNFYALPFGHVESDVYTDLGALNLFTITNENLVPKESYTSEYFNGIEDIKPLLDNSFTNLRKANPELIEYSAFDLVELSHQWQSWKTTYNLARQQNRKRIKIPVKLIQSEEKLFSI